MRYFLDNKPPQHLNALHIHYIELVNENPDSDETMGLVTEVLK